MHLTRPTRLQKNSRCASRRRGLTLFELLIVMSILATLVTLVIGLGRYADTMAKRHHAIADLGKWQEALHQYYLQLGEYPGIQYTNAASLLTLNVSISGSNTISFGSGMPGSLAAITLDPWGQPYQYAAPTNSNLQSFDLYSCGPDRAGGTSDDIRFQP